jgi:hypothetical protein
MSSPKTYNCERNKESGDKDSYTPLTKLTPARIVCIGHRMHPTGANIARRSRALSARVPLAILLEGTLPYKEKRLLPPSREYPCVTSLSCWF